VRIDLKKIFLEEINLKRISLKETILKEIGQVLYNTYNYIERIEVGVNIFTRAKTPPVILPFNIFFLLIIK